MPSQIYEGQVKVYDKKADGSTLIIGKGDRQGEPYYKLSFKVGDAWVNLMDFDGVTGGSAGAYHVEFYQKFHPNGDPDLYNDKPQYQLDSIWALGNAPATQQAHSAAPVAQVGDDAKTRDIRRAVALKAATELTAAMLPHLTDTVSFAYLDRVLADADRMYAWLETGTVLDVIEDDDTDEDIPF
jgi:hypothetical protein